MVKWTTEKSWYPCSHLSTGGPKRESPSFCVCVCAFASGCVGWNAGEKAAHIAGGGESHLEKIETAFPGC